MIFFSTALQAEARPLIRELGLKKYSTGNRFRIYHSDDFALCVTGTGKIKSAVSTTFMLTHFRAGHGDIVINAGMCGAVSAQAESGTVFLAACIRDNGTGKWHYPDILINHPFREGILETFSMPVSDRHAPDRLADMVDMEGAAVFEAASAFVPLHHIFVLKVVLDNIEPAGLTGRNIEDTMSEAASGICRFALALRDTPANPSCSPCSDITRFLKATPGVQCLSVTMKSDLEALLKYAVLSNNRLAIDLIGKTAAALQNISCRKDAKKLISDLRTALYSVPVRPRRQ